MFFYSVGIYLYTFSIKLVSLFNPKAKLWVNGRKNWREDLQNKLQKINSHPKIWIHCASLGEFEQGRPIIETLKQNYPKYKIILSFFSPSGYEQQKKYEMADVITYLPADTYANARDFINYCSPHTVIFVKYEFWLNYLFELERKKIPTFLASAVIKEHQPFFKWYGKIFVKALATYKKIIVQDKGSLLLLQSLKIPTGILGGDTRIDRVIDLRKKHLDLPQIASFTSNKPVIIAGSTWPKDEAILIPAFIKLKQKHSGLKLIVAPHETHEKNIVHLTQNLTDTGISFSLYTSGKDFSGSDILIVDTVGLLSSVYKYGTAAFIGGGFDHGIHNILEPATYGLPIAIGPNNKKFNEATDLMRSGGVKEISTDSELFRVMDDYLSDKNLHQQASKACTVYIDLNKGAYQKVIAELSL